MKKVWLSKTVWIAAIALAAAIAQIIADREVIDATHRWPAWPLSRSCSGSLPKMP